MADKKQNFFVGNNAHWEDIYAKNEKAQFYKDSETDFVICNYTPKKSVEGASQFFTDGNSFEII